MTTPAKLGNDIREQRITLPLTVADDLGKRWSAWR